jgi:NAD(P)-dependent dehydrogenase (short-subunit alcohol dehydrogenase family)
LVQCVCLSSWPQGTHHSPTPVTGTRSNFGIALVRAALAAGHRVVATARTPTALPFEPCASLLVLELDVTKQAQIDAALEAAIDRFGRIDVVVNKSGASLICEVEGTPDEEARGVFETQFWGPAALSKAVGVPCFFPEDALSHVTSGLRRSRSSVRLTRQVQVGAS